MNNLSNKNYRTDSHLWTCGNNLTSVRWGGRGNFANGAFKAG